jgi:5-methylcytosine-specific restriction endonuclease McrA
VRKASGDRCGRVFRISRQSATKCASCLRTAREEKRASRGDRRKRKGEYTKPPKKFWGKKNRQRQIEEAGAKCEVCGKTEVQCRLDYDGSGLIRDHTLPVRFIQFHNLGDAHIDLNITMICSSCGGNKSRAEGLLERGDMVGFLTDLKKWGWNMKEVGMVFKYYGIYSATLSHYFH